MEKLKVLLTKGHITPYQYDTYVLFNLNEFGRDYLKKMFEMILLEEPEKNRETGFAWQDGRRSIWREIQLDINFINHKLKEVMDDDEDKHGNRGSDEFSFYGNDAIPFSGRATTGNTTVKG